MAKLTIGTLAHVDAGKTSLCEAILFKTGSTLKMGRVDNGNAFLDFDSQERQRGITIFNKQARFKYKDTDYIYLDTPGHNEFLSEANRAYRVIDLALLIISGSEQIYGDDILKFNHLLNLNIPLIIFVNKEDNLYTDKESIIKNIQKRFNQNCVAINQICEHISLLSEDLLEQYLENGNLDKEIISKAITNNDCIPILFGSALKDSGVDELLDFIDTYIPKYSTKENKLNAYVYGISNDNNKRIVHLKVLSGTLYNKMSFNESKINEIRLYNGKSYKSVQEVESGDLCAVLGLNDVQIGMYLPSFIDEKMDEIQMLTYELKSGIDNNELFRKLSCLNAEQPELGISLSENHLYINLSGDLKKQIIYNLIKERFNIEVSFSDPVIIYKESVKETSFGVGHFEPLRHYGEVIVELKPAKGLIFKSLVNNSYTGSLIQYLNTFKPRGILTNSYLTNVEITIIDFKTHIKHTEGGDLIEALRRAIRHALTRNKSYVLEPYYLLNIEATNMNAIISVLNTENFTFTVNEDSIICKIPQKKYNSFILNLRTRLKDKLNYEVLDNIYDEAQNEEEIIDARHYDYKNDFRNPAGSVFTYHGAGHYVSEEDVISKMHLKLDDYFKDIKEEVVYKKGSISENELNRVWNNLYKPKERYIPKTKSIQEELEHIEIKSKPLIYIIDGYNLMYSLDELKDIVNSNFIMAREKVIDICSDFKGYVNAEVILVFDAYRQEYGKAQVSTNNVINIVYTKSLQTADTYIENATRDLSKDNKVITVTNDHLEQLRVFSNSSMRLSCTEFMARYHNMKKTYCFDDIPKNKPLLDLRSLLENE